MRIRNARAGGSSPLAGTTFSKGLAGNRWALWLSPGVRNGGGEQGHSGTPLSAIDEAKAARSEWAPIPAMNRLAPVPGGPLVPLERGESMNL